MDVDQRSHELAPAALSRITLRTSMFTRGTSNGRTSSARSRWLAMIHRHRHVKLADGCAIAGRPVVLGRRHDGYAFRRRGSHTAKRSQSLGLVERR
jgi:hypothetical protein